jgi:acylphosphatase
MSGGGRRAVRLRIEGLVQGVGFRFWTAREAARMGLDGCVRNRADGSVEAVFAGPGEAVAEMVAACRRGPRAARVDQVTVTDETLPVAPGFSQAPTM